MKFISPIALCLGVAVGFLGCSIVGRLWSRENIYRNYVRLHLGSENHLFRETMHRMESRLDTRRFARIHRSRIVNTDRIKEMQPWFNGEYVVVLQNGTRLTLSRGYREKLQERLGKGF